MTLKKLNGKQTKPPPMTKKPHKQAKHQSNQQKTKNTQKPPQNKQEKTLTKLINQKLYFLVNRGKLLTGIA